MTHEFHWKCQICKQPIYSGLIEKWMDKRKARFHKSCLEKQDVASQEADKILDRIKGGRHKYE